MSDPLWVKIQERDETCARYRRMIERGDEPSEIVTGLAAVYGVNRPAIWRRLRAGGALPPYRTGVRTMRRAPRSNLEVEIDTVAMPRVDRDPCQRCGIRADVGCKHTRAPVGMLFG